MHRHEDTISGLPFGNGRRQRLGAHPKALQRILIMALGALALTGSAASARVTPAIKCKTVKTKAVGRHAFMLLKALAANEKKPNASKLATASAKAQSKLTKAFSKAEAKDGCVISGDAVTLAATTDAYVENVLEQLAGHAGTTSTSTTTSITTMSTTTTTLPPGSGNVLISEVLYDPSGADDGLEWVELHNTGSLAVDLSTYSLGYGGNDYTAGTFQLSGMLPAGATFVLGGPVSDTTNGSPAYDLALDFAPDLQNGGTIGDGIALFDIPASEITATTVPIDAVVYGPNNDNGLIDEVGVVSPPEVEDAPSGASIERVDSAGTWHVQDAPTPNTTPF